MRYSPEKDWGAVRGGLVACGPRVRPPLISPQPTPPPRWQNAGLGLARALLEKVKAAHPGASYADIYTLAGVVAVQAM